MGGEGMRGVLKPVRTPAGSLLGLIALGVIAIMLLRHQLTLVGAAERAGIVFGAVLVLERILLPIGSMLVHIGPAPVPEEGAGEGAAKKPARAGARRPAGPPPKGKKGKAKEPKKGKKGKGSEAAEGKKK
jgi:hypothetical protein